MSIRENFPKQDDPPYEGGTSDGWEYQIAFRGGNLDASFAMIRSFLQEEGFEDLPVPMNAFELSLFKINSI